MALSRTARMKPTARRVFDRADALYLHESPADGAAVEELLAGLRAEGWHAAAGLPLYTRETLPQLVDLIEHSFCTNFEKAGGK
jgi:hypothetical protein